jgi:hypothetical protein
MARPRLVVTNPAPMRGTVLELDRPRLTLGRDQRADLRLPDPLVSGVHARFDHDGIHTTVVDLGSTNGTTVNGAAVRGETLPLRDGDVLRFANVEVRFETPGGPQPVVPAAGPDAGYHIDSQSGGWINNVEGAPYNYIKQVTEQRESFLREVAATKTKARRLIWVGFALFVLGGGTYFWVAARAAGQMSDFISGVQTADPDSFVEPRLPEIFGERVAGVPLAFFGVGAVALGVVLMVVGLVLHVVAASRRKRLETTAVASPWPVPPRSAY